MKIASEMRPKSAVRLQISSGLGSALQVARSRVFLEIVFAARFSRFVEEFQPKIKNLLGEFGEETVGEPEHC